MQPAVAYENSTAQQGKSGLGLEAQQAALARFAEAEGYRFVQTFDEVETRARARMPSIAAPSSAQPSAPPRLTRWQGDADHRRQALPAVEGRTPVSFLMGHRTPFIVAEARPRTLIRSVLHLYAALAEKERRLISQRTKDARSRRQEGCRRQARRLQRQEHRQPRRGQDEGRGAAAHPRRAGGHVG